MGWYCPAAVVAATPLMAWLRRRKNKNARPTRTSTATGMPTPSPIFRAFGSSELVDGPEEGSVAESVSEVRSEGVVGAGDASDASEEAVLEAVVKSDDDPDELRVVLVTLVVLDLLVVLFVPFVPVSLVVLVVAASVVEDVLLERPVGVAVYRETPFVGG